LKIKEILIWHMGCFLVDRVFLVKTHLVPRRHVMWIRSYIWIFLTVVILAVSGCGGGGSGHSSSDGNSPLGSDGSIVSEDTAPLAEAGPDRNASVGVPVVLDDGSSNGDGESTTEEWTVVEAPEDSEIKPGETVDDSADGLPVFTPDVIGEYVLSLVVCNGSICSEPCLKTITAVNSFVERFDGFISLIKATVKETLDGGFALLEENLLPAGLCPISLIKTDENGVECEQKFFGEFGDTVVSSIRETSENCFTLMRYTVNNNICLLDATNSEENVSISEAFDEVEAVQSTLDGSFVLAGCQNGQLALAKFNSAGGKNWEVPFEGTGGYHTISIQETSSGDFVLGSYSEGGDDLFLTKISSAGEELWEKTFVEIEGYDTTSIQETSDGCFVLTGYFGLEGADKRTILTKISSEGEEIWKKIFMGIGENIINSVQETSDGGYVLTAADCLGIGDVIYLLKTDGSGNIKPQSTPIDNLFLNENTPLALDISGNFDDINGDSLTYAALGLPSGIIMDPDAGLLSGTLPSVNGDTAYEITVIATDPGGLSTAETFNLTVVDVG
jgi:hypothetical protein